MVTTQLPSEATGRRWVGAVRSPSLRRNPRTRKKTRTASVRSSERLEGVSECCLSDVGERE